MTTLTAPTVTPSLGNRIVAVVRLHLANRWTVIYTPWLIMLAILALNAAIWALILGSTPPSEHAEIREGFTYSGATSYMFVYMMVVAVQAISVTFRFAQGFSVTRRDYYVGTAVTFVGFALMYAVGLSILGVIEQATDGWGLGGALFTSPIFGATIAERALSFLLISLFFFFVGGAVASIWVRWKGFGLIGFFVALAFALVGVMALIGLTDSWGRLFTWLGSIGWTGAYLWSLVPTAVAALGGYLVLRRATPQG